jgi:hypothetical protein
MRLGKVQRRQQGDRQAGGDQGCAIATSSVGYSSLASSCSHAAASRTPTGSGDAPARWTNISTPAGFEQFVADVAALHELTPDALRAAATARGIEILGPPPGTMP